jgi:UDPglucose--hexose-1-phosphate uridylyltransferase
MSQLRKDPIVGRWVIIAENRAKRPNDFEHASTPRRHKDRFCPFCEGNEHATPDEIIAYRGHKSQANGQGWTVRVVANKFPALIIEDELSSHKDGIYDVMQGVGAHEVIIESPQHLISTSDLSEEQLREVLWAYRDRLVDLKKDPRLVYGMIFKNVGVEAGASLEHTHSQLIVTPIVPITVVEEMSGSLDFYNNNDRCIYCDMIQQELEYQQRVVLDTPDFLAFCPFASRFPFETWVLPKSHSSHYEAISDGQVKGLSDVFRRVITKVESALDRPAYNYIVHTAPFDTWDLKHYHWHIEVIPSLTRTAGFEWGTGFYVNPMLPEKAAEFLRSAGTDGS